MRIQGRNLRPGLRVLIPVPDFGDPGDPNYKPAHSEAVTITSVSGGGGKLGMVFCETVETVDFGATQSPRFCTPALWRGFEVLPI